MTHLQNSGVPPHATREARSKATSDMAIQGIQDLRQNPGAMHRELKTCCAKWGCEPGVLISF